ncbi:MAG: PilZ domain-containing protein [Candidatus Omnitrophica bacterium]|nr:PilZ domain-containing protein [Candidatus Omnitrophota bacterium]
MDKTDPENLPNAREEKAFPVPNSVKARYRDEKGLSRDIKIRSLSRGGISIEYGTRLEVGTCLRLVLSIKDKKIEAQGEVVWNDQENSVFTHGIKFTFMKQEGRDWFNTFIMDWAAEQIAQELDFSGLTALPQAEAVERRAFARLKIPLRIEVGFKEDTMLFQTQIYDLSEGGLCLISNFELKKDQELKLKLWLSENKCLQINGRVKYSVKKVHDNRNVTFHGVEFAQMSDLMLQTIVQFLNQKRSEMAAIEISLDDIMGQTDLPELP